MTQQKNRLFCFTDYVLDADLYDQSTLGFSYAIAGEEICPSTNRKHWQGFMYFKNARSLSSIIKKMKPRHVEMCLGSAAQNIKYCSKDANIVFEIGDKPSPGNRTDIAAARDEILGGKKVDDICLDNPEFYHKYGRTLSKIEDIALRKRFRTEMTKGTWLYGPTYAGKSHDAFTNFNPDTHYVLPDDNGWWDGYTGQETVIINDYRGSLSYGFLLNLVDKWPVSVRRRCREPAPFLAKEVIITSSQQPHEVYNNLAENDDLAQLYRRFSVVYCPSKDERVKTTQRYSGGNTEPLSQKKNNANDDTDVFDKLYAENCGFS